MTNMTYESLKPTPETDLSPAARLILEAAGDASVAYVLPDGRRVSGTVSEALPQCEHLRALGPIALAAAIQDGIDRAARGE